MGTSARLIHSCHATIVMPRVSWKLHMIGDTDDSKAHANAILVPQTHLIWIAIEFTASICCFRDWTRTLAPFVIFLRTWSCRITFPGRACVLVSPSNIIFLRAHCLKWDVSEWSLYCAYEVVVVGDLWSECVVQLGVATAPTQIPHFLTRVSSLSTFP